jgi:hypothetical protein
MQESCSYGTVGERGGNEPLYPDAWCILAQLPPALAGRINDSFYSGFSRIPTGSAFYWRKRPLVPYYNSPVSWPWPFADILN